MVSAAGHLWKLTAFGSVGLVVALGLVTMQTYAGWGTRHPTWNRPIDFPNRGAARALDPGEFTAPEVCGTCHVRHYEEWKASAMGQSVELARFLLDLYAVSLDVRGAPREDIAFCLHCHAPLALIGDDPDFALEREASLAGVTCDVCHVAVVAYADDAPGHIEWDPTGPKRGPFPGDEATGDGAVPAAVSPFHETRYSELHTSSGLCAACHMSLWPSNALPVDWTYPEWERSPWAEEGIGCPECHMPTYTGVAAPGAPERPDLHRHDFPGGGDEAFVQTTLDLDLQAYAHHAGHEIIVRVENTGAGHSFPTGNANIPVVSLVVKATDTAGEVVFEDQRDYRVIFEDALGQPTYDVTIAVRLQADDALVAREPRQERFYLPRSVDAAAVTAEVVYRRWSPEIVDNHAGVVFETVSRFAHQGVQLHRFAARFAEMDYGRIERVAALKPIVVVERTTVLPALPGGGGR